MPTDRISGSHDDPVVVIGGGVIGVCCAYFLAKAGIPVLLLEESEICSGCSFGNLGLLAASHSTPLASPGVIFKALRWMFNKKSPFSIHLRPDPQLVSWLWRFFRASRSHRSPTATAELLKLVLASMALFDELTSTNDFTFGLEKKGVLELFTTTEGFAAAENRAPALRDAGLNVDVLDAIAVKAWEPLAASGVRGGLLYHDDCHVQPANFVRGLAALAVKAGAEIQEHTAVTDFSVPGNRISGVTTDKSFHKASAVILAAGAASPKLAGALDVKLPVQAARGYSFTIPAPVRRPSRPIMFSEAKALLTPMGNELRLGGVLELTGAGTEVDTRRAKALLKSCNRYLLPEISFDGVAPWSGYRPCSPDGFPIVGWSQRWPNLLYATGHGMLGLTLGPLTGQIATSLLKGEKARRDMARIVPSRFGNSL